MTNNVNRYEKPVLPNPLNSERRKTDVFYLYVFGLFCIISIGISIYVFVIYHDQSKLHKGDRYSSGHFISSSFGIDFEGFDKFINNYGLNKNATPSILATLFYLLFFFFFIVLLYWKPKILIYLARVMLYIFIITVAIFWSLLTIALIFLGVTEIVHVLKIQNIFGFIKQYVVPGVSLVVLVPTVICLKKEGVKPISEILKKSCRALVFFRSTFYCIVFILFYFVTVVMEIFLLLTMKSIYFKENLSGILLCMCVFGGCYISSFLFYFGIAVIANTIASWYYSQDNDEIPAKSIWDSIRIVCRYHLGTIAFGATVILPFFLAIFVACKHTVERCRNTIIAKIFKLVLIGNITNFALIQTAIHGYNFAESTKRSFDLMVKNYSISLALIKVFEFVMSIIVELPLILSMLLIAAHGYYMEQIELSIVYEYGTIIQILTLPVIIIIGTSVNTTLIYKLQKQEAEVNAEMNIFCVQQNGNVV